MNKKNIFVALDVDFNEALTMANSLKSLVYGYKIGSVLFNSISLEQLQKFDNVGVPLFLDLKWFEIPSIVKKNILLFKQFKNIQYITIHSLSSKEMIEAAVNGAKEIGHKLNVMAVTILTSTKSIKEIGLHNNIEEQVKLLTKFSKDCGADGVISSARNLKMIRNIVGDDFKIICPGIRSTDQDKNDQSSTMAYSEFNKIANNNSYCVIGRPVYESKNPIEALNKIINS